MSGPLMWPLALPAQIRGDRYRAAEVRIYDLLRTALGTGWTVFYSRPWLGLTATGGERDGECDFLVVHPKLGLLALEVKGGGISFDPSTETWTSRDRDGIRHIIKNPIAQARSAKHQLLKRLKDVGGWPVGQYVRARHGVIFPDVMAPPGDLGADRPRELFCCRPDLGNIAGWIMGRLSGGDEEGPGTTGVRAIERLLARPFTLRVPLGHVLADDDQLIASLTPQQFHIMNAVSGLPRVAVGGGAGTGKTVVAVEDAMRLSDAGLRVLLTCRSGRLAADLRARTDGGNVRVQSFEELCASTARDAGLLNEAARPFSEAESPDLLVRAATLAPSVRVDAIVVDEAQDFRAHWWVALEALLTDAATGRLHVFYDTNQSVYGDITGQLAGFSMVPIHLGRNLRNTRAIHAVAARFYRGLPVTADGPEGVPVEWLGCRVAEVAAQVSEVVGRLVHREAVRPEDIAVLTGAPTVLSKLQHSLGHHVHQGLVVASIEDFKGLERPVVVVAATPEVADAVELTYVGMSRARTHLVVVGEPRLLDWFRQSGLAEDNA